MILIAMLNYGLLDLSLHWLSFILKSLLVKLSAVLQHENACPPFLDHTLQIEMILFVSNCPRAAEPGICGVIALCYHRYS
jgi:hypothetical protein